MSADSEMKIAELVVQADEARAEAKAARERVAALEKLLSRKAEGAPEGEPKAKRQKTKKAPYQSITCADCSEVTCEACDEHKDDKPRFCAKHAAVERKSAFVGSLGRYYMDDATKDVFACTKLPVGYCGCLEAEAPQEPKPKKPKAPASKVCKQCVRFTYEDGAGATVHPCDEHELSTMKPPKGMPFGFISSRASLVSKTDHTKRFRFLRKTLLQCNDCSIDVCSHCRLPAWRHDALSESEDDTRLEEPHMCKLHSHMTAHPRLTMRTDRIYHDRNGNCVQIRANFVRVGDCHMSSSDGEEKQYPPAPPVPLGDRAYLQSAYDKMTSEQKRELPMCWDCECYSVSCCNHVETNLCSKHEGKGFIRLKDDDFADCEAFGAPNGKFFLIHVMDQEDELEHDCKKDKSSSDQESSDEQ